MGGRYRYYPPARSYEPFIGLVITPIILGFYDCNASPQAYVPRSLTQMRHEKGSDAKYNRRIRSSDN